MQKLDLKKLDEIDIKGIWTIDFGNFKEGYEMKGVISHTKIYSKGAFFSNHIFTFRLLGVAKLLGIVMWLLSALVWIATIFAISNGQFNIGQLIFCFLFTSLYLLLFRGANKKLINTWQTRYTKKTNSWINANINSEENEFKTDAVVLIENDEVILTNEYVLNKIGDGSFNDFLKLMDDISDSVVEKMKEHKKEEEKKKKEYEKKELSAGWSDIKDMAGNALSEHIKNQDAKGRIDNDVGGFLARRMGDSLDKSAAKKRSEGKFANKMDDLKAEEKQRREKDSVDIKDVIEDAKKKHQDD
tara:strand:+ start:65 stop:964 length:900 start_codon:yes stop_codon:yes gene_type:complete